MGRRGSIRTALALGLLAAPLACLPAHAAWKLVTRGQPVEVAKGKLSVTPGEDWNRSTSRPVKKSEVWTLDGGPLNELYFVSGLAPGETLFKDRDKKKNPLPRMGANMLLTDIPDFFESSTRIALQTSLFEVDRMEPTIFAGHPGIAFSFSYGIQQSPVVRKGIAAATLVDGQLYLISFIAPAIYYFDRDLPKAQAVIASAKL